MSYPDMQRTYHCGGSSQFPYLSHAPDCPLARLQSDMERPQLWTGGWGAASGCLSAGDEGAEALAGV
ncbi:hypothetical protein E2P81_ATG05757 [Venturia nashicola]|nr:hypothetical protein E2P81_ATG05757 [Venturia nashicola]